MSEIMLSHAYSTTDTELDMAAIRARICAAGDKPHVTVDEQLQVLDELAQFAIGRFLLKNRGVNGYWTYYAATYPHWKGTQELSTWETYLLSQAPLTIAVQQKFQIFLQENQKSVRDGARLATIPSGVMGELLDLDFTGIDDITLVGIDCDAETLQDAQQLAQQKGLQDCVELYQKDAWNMQFENEFDLISSNGLTIYEPDDERVVALYAEFYRALRPGGRLVTSFITAPPTPDDPGEWRLDLLNPEDLRRQRIIYADVVDAQWQSFRSSELTKQQLTAAGFVDIQIIPDAAHLFPTVTASKSYD